MENRAFFQKLKDYNKILEKVLDGKYISGNAKNIILSMAYKIENSYNDYMTVKRNVKSKDDFLTELIYNVQEYVEHIKFAEPNSKDEALLKKYKVNALSNEKEKSILAYSTELAVLFGISDITPKFFYIDDNEKLKKQIQYMLVDGCNQNTVEVLKNFNGWSWYNEYDKRNNYVNNIIYQNLLMLLGNKFIDDWKDNSSLKVDSIRELKNMLSHLYGKINMSKFYVYMCRVLILSSKNKEKLIHKYNSTIEKYNLISNKKAFLNYLYENKMKISENAQRLRLIQEKEKLLVKEIRKRNLELDKDKQITSKEQMRQILQREIRELKKDLQYIDELSNPKVYLIKKEELEQECEIVKDIENAELEEELLKLEKAFISCMEQKLQNVHLSDDIINLIYELRYYRNIYFYKDKLVKDIEVLENRTQKLMKEVITVACKFGLVTIFCDNADYNYSIISHFLDTNIIDIDDIRLSININSTKDRIKVTIYDKDVIEKSVELRYNLSEKNLKVRIRKPTKIII